MFNYQYHCKQISAYTFYIYLYYCGQAIEETIIWKFNKKMNCINQSTLIVTKECVDPNSNPRNTIISVWTRLYQSKHPAMPMNECTNSKQNNTVISKWSCRSKNMLMPVTKAIILNHLAAKICSSQHLSKFCFQGLQYSAHTEINSPLAFQKNGSKQTAHIRNTKQPQNI